MSKTTPKKTLLIKAVPYRGGYWNNGSNNGVWYASINTTRANANNNIGLRPAFYEPAA